jgi:hypothetical protein
MLVATKRSWLQPALIASLLGACSAEDSLGRFGTGGRTTSSGTQGTVGAGGGVSTGGGDSIGGSGGAGTGTGGWGTGGGGAGGTTPEPQLACRAKAVVDARCAGTCHSSPPKFGAPSALTAWSDFQRNSSKEPARKLYDVARDRIHAGGSARMPPTDELAPSELATLDAWFAAGAPAGAGCGAPPGSNDGGGYTDAALPDAPTDDGTECFEFRAHGQMAPGDTSVFDTSTLILPANEFYACFNFTPPWKVPVQGLQFATIVDNEEVLHHWLLYSSVLGAQDGSFSYCLGQHPGQTLVTGWAPGNDGLKLPPDVGLELPPPTGSYVLEVHYNNPSGKPFRDRSGVRVCATSRFRPKTASITWAGTENINLPPRAMGSASGKCIPERRGLGGNDVIHIFNAWPHMHVLGTHMTTVIQRAGGQQEVLLDKPFNFQSQIGYDVDFVINPGDTLFTTCQYQNTTAGPVGFGPSTSQEMCYDFLYAYPAHALDHPPFGKVITSGAANLCTDN